jgi:hypothetical protein
MQIKRGTQQITNAPQAEFIAAQNRENSLVF